MVGDKRAVKNDTVCPMAIMTDNCKFLLEMSGSSLLVCFKSRALYSQCQILRLAFLVFLLHVRK